MRIWHLTIASDGRRPLFVDEASVRAAVRTLARVAGDDMALFCIVDDHVHVVALGEPARAGKLARALVLGLRPQAGAPVERARVREVESRSHMQWLVSYVLGQGPHHGLPEHPALASGSCFQDLAGARRIDGLRLRIGEALPRYRRRDLYAAARLPAVEIAPASDARIVAAGMARLAAAVASALAVAPGLAGNTPPVVAARRSFAHLARAAGFDSGDLVRTLGISSRSARRLDERPVPAEVLRAVRVRLAVEDAVAVMR